MKSKVKETKRKNKRQSFKALYTHKQTQASKPGAVCHYSVL